MQTSDCFSPGFVLRPHGIKGSILLGLNVEDSRAYSELGAIFIEIHQNLIPYIVEEISIKGNKAYVKLEGVDTPEQAESLKKKTVWLPLDMMSEADQHSPERLIGFQISDVNLGNLGILQEITGSKFQKVFSVLHPEGKEILIPFTPEIVKDIDLQGEKIKVDCPDGLIDLYLSDQNDTDEEE